MISIRERLEAIERGQAQLLAVLSALLQALGEGDEDEPTTDLDGRTTARERDQTEEL